MTALAAASLVTLPEKAALSALRIWNYNKTAEDTHRGVKWVKVSVDGKWVCPKSGLLVRKAPGNTMWDFGQTLCFELVDVPDRVKESPPPANAVHHDLSSFQRGFVWSLFALSINFSAHTSLIGPPCPERAP